jgi:[acyl-carrier-protein] S-malonyltransferase
VARPGPAGLGRPTQLDQRPDTQPDDPLEEHAVKPFVMFPGQGSQRPGMAAGLLADFPASAGPVFALADDVLGMPLTRLCQDADADQLRQTDVTQPAILATSLATLAVLRDGGLEPAAAAGHSLGEYAAMVAAGVLAPESALRLVRRRGELMAGVGATVPGAMAAVIGLPGEDVEALCAEVSAEATAGVAEVANLNEPLQTVVSGHAAAVEVVGSRAIAAGAERVVNLLVSAPFHCSLMAPVAAEFAAELARHEFTAPEIPLFSAVTGDLVTTGQELRRLLERQLTAPVRWSDTLRRAVAAGYGPLVETGPGRVLTGFAKQIVPEVPVYGTATPRALTSLLARADLLADQEAA